MGLQHIVTTTFVAAVLSAEKRRGDTALQLVLAIRRGLHARLRYNSAVPGLPRGALRRRNHRTRMRRELGSGWQFSDHIGLERHENFHGFTFPTGRPSARLCDRWRGQKAAAGHKEFPSG